MSKKLKVGDIFYLKLKNQEKYVFGRVLFDVKKQYQKIVNVNNLPSDYFPYLKMFYSDCHLVEMYDGLYDQSNSYDSTSKIIIPRVLTQAIDSKWNILNWGIIKNEPVDYTKVEFPEHLNIMSNIVKLDRGEISLKTNMNIKDNIIDNFNSEMYVPATIAYASLDFQNKRELIPEDARWPEYIKNGDLLYHTELRRKIYNDLNIDPDKSYYELSKEMGFDLERFY
ncbi:Imm26 family immunity protein [Chryseobacterium jejuense]|uniref:Immunity protein 26 n=1 Tax=Chryseobacterium jejuense TaxID=445960 RepID=A0A2X2VD71_CHRJE|nr:Imm26 family immunity protein [Chryseobacterium jejuense]SDI39743.1 Immunity protein 26 [Chryseobacterium jejuense]SQB26946.1 Uncharacterised protein [Chryseobacterium jejuense]